jgi:mRNA interferase MazF
MVMRRGEIWWADLGEPSGAAPGFERPILIVSSDSYNRSKIETIVGLAITSNVRLADAPGNVLLGINDAGLERPSVVNVSQVVTLDKSDLRERLGVLAPDQLRLVDIGLRRVLNL